jgi:hypothetical protein
MLNTVIASGVYLLGKLASRRQQTINSWYIIEASELSRLSRIEW